MEHMDTSRDQGPLHGSSDPSFKILEAEILWPAVKQKTEAKTKGLRFLCKEKDKKDGWFWEPWLSVSLLVQGNMMQKREARVWSLLLSDTYW